MGVGDRLIANLSGYKGTLVRVGHSKKGDISFSFMAIFIHTTMVPYSIIQL